MSTARRTIKRKRAAKVATVEQLAAMNFKPWVHTPGEWTPPTAAQWAELENPYLVSVRIAWLTMHRNKRELVDIVDGLWSAGDGEGEAFRGLIEQLQQASLYFKGYVAMLDGAETRLMCASAAAEDDGPDGGAS